jgi:hypothetical protein
MGPGAWGAPYVAVQHFSPSRIASRTGGLFRGKRVNHRQQADPRDHFALKDAASTRRCRRR